MIKSMTGFGKGEAVLQNKKITVEIRSLNSKQMDLSLRLPAIYRQSEYEIRTMIARSLQRGKIEVIVDELEFMSSRNSGAQQSGGYQSGGYDAPSYGSPAPAQAYSAPAPVIDASSSVYDEDIPF